jgi:hypothetical protein
VVADGGNSLKAVPLEFTLLRSNLGYKILERMMQYCIPKSITVIFLIIGLFPALSTAQSNIGPWDPVEQQPDPYKALQEQLNGYKRQDEQKRRKQDQQQKAYKDWIMGGPPPNSQKSFTPPASTKPQNRYRPPQNTQRGAGYGNQQRPQVQGNRGTPRRTQPQARSQGLGGKPSGVTTNPSRSHGLDRFRAGEVQKTTPQKKPTKYCACRGDHWSEFGSFCLPIGGSPKDSYKPGHYTWTPQCRSVVWK